MLSVVPPLAADRLSEAQLVLAAVEFGRPALWALCELALLPLLAVCLLAAGLDCPGGLLLGVAVALALRRYGPSWWPGRR